MECPICKKEYGSLHSHHRVLRKECKPLEKCELNIIKICPFCHDFIHHDSKGYELLKKLKKEFQEELENSFYEENLSREEIKEVLKISDKPLDKLLKPLVSNNGLFAKEDVIRACMGGKIMI